MQAALIVDMVLDIAAELALQMVDPTHLLPNDLGQIGWKKLTVFELI